MTTPIIITSETPFMSIDDKDIKTSKKMSFSKIGEDQLKKYRDEYHEKYGNNIELKIIQVECISYEMTGSMYIYETTTWDDICNGVLEQINNISVIKSLGVKFGETSIWLYGGKLSKVVSYEIEPYKYLSEGDIMHVKMLKRDIGWIPVIVGIRECVYCKKLETQTEKMKMCSGCKCSMYCNKECQKNDWKAHKIVCKDE